VNDLYEVKYFESEISRSHIEPKLDSRLSHPDRYRYANCWGEYRSGVLHCCLVGSEGWFPFMDNFCPRFLGEYPAIVLGKIDSSRSMECDRFVEY
jgi:hypothetical protein